MNMNLIVYVFEYFFEPVAEAFLPAGNAQFTKGAGEMALTDLIIRNAKPRQCRYLLCDGGGLNLEVMTSGSKFWRLRYREGGRERRLTLGQYPSLSLAEARSKRDELKASREQGLSPAGVIHPVKLPTFQEVALEWMEKQADQWVPEHTATVRQRLETWLFPTIGERPLKEITAPEVLKALRAIEERGLIETAKRTRQIFSLVARYGVAVGACDVDVSYVLVWALKPHKVKPMSALTKTEDIQCLIQAMKEYKGSLVVRTALWFSLYTLARPGEIRHAEWKEIDLENATWSIPAEKMKRRKSHVVPLCRQAVELLKALREKTGRGRYVFPSTHTPNGMSPMSKNTITSALRRMGFTSEEMTAHGFRSLGSTRLNEMGFRWDVIEAALAHTQGGVRGIYNRAEYLDERRAMLQEFADCLHGL